MPHMDLHDLTPAYPSVLILDPSPPSHHAGLLLFPQCHSCLPETACSLNAEHALPPAHHMAVSSWHSGHLPEAPLSEWRQQSIMVNSTDPGATPLGFNFFSFVLILERETLNCCSIYLCIHWLILVCTLTRDQTYNIGLSKHASTKLATWPRQPIYSFSKKYILLIMLSQF